LHCGQGFHFYARWAHCFCGRIANDGELKTIICPKFCGLVGQDWDKDLSQVK
jgi:hypothetical protein